MPLIMHSESAASSSSAGFSASRRPASAVSSVSEASLHMATLPDASTRRVVTANSNFAGTTPPAKRHQRRQARDVHTGRGLHLTLRGRARAVTKRDTRFRGDPWRTSRINRIGSEDVGMPWFKRGALPVGRQLAKMDDFMAPPRT
jgi:hypothetical protein